MSVYPAAAAAGNTVADKNSGNRDVVVASANTPPDPKTPDQELLAAMWREDVAAVRAALDKGADIECKEENVIPHRLHCVQGVIVIFTLHCCVHTCCFASADASLPPSPTRQDASASTPLLVAASFPPDDPKSNLVRVRESCARLLLVRGANTEATSVRCFRMRAHNVLSAPPQKQAHYALDQKRSRDSRAPMHHRE
jgi:hypothetical protein